MNTSQSLSDKTRTILVAFLLLSTVLFPGLLHAQELKDGDIIFQSSDSRQCRAIKLATHSDITHCGMILQKDGKWHVLEAVEPVQLIPLAQFVSRNPGGHYTVKRVKQDKTLNDAAVQDMLNKGKKWLGVHYDIYFNWSEKELYCSELVWKLYHGAGITLCEPKALKEFDLDAPLVKMMMKERYGKNIPYNEHVVAPSDIFNSSLLFTVVDK